MVVCGLDLLTGICFDAPQFKEQNPCFLHNRTFCVTARKLAFVDSDGNKEPSPGAGWKQFIAHDK
jgi:hypothetical protein